MDELPPEILYVIVSCLDIDALQNVRLVNRRFADMGASYMLPEVTFCMHSDELARLQAISLHPVFSKHVRSLTYFAHALDSPQVSWREFLRDYKLELRWNSRLKKLNYHPNQLLAEYNKYCDAAAKQDLIMNSEADIALLNDVLPRFPKLESMTMSSGGRFYEGTHHITKRHKALDDILRGSTFHSLNPEGSRPLEALLVANAEAKCALKSFRAGFLHWKFFKRPEWVLRRMFTPLANLTSIEISISLDSGEEETDRFHEHDSLIKCQRVMAKGSLRHILKSMPLLQTICVEFLDMDVDELTKGAALADIMEPGFHWPQLHELALGGLSCDRKELMDCLMLHKDTLQVLCLRDMALKSTSWCELLPDIRKKMNLADACICGVLYGYRETDEFDDAALEYWDLSVPEVGDQDMRDSVNVYCRHGGTEYPDELPLSNTVVAKYYEEYVRKHYRDDEDGEEGGGILKGEDQDDQNWEDVTDEEEISDELSTGSLDSMEVPASFTQAVMGDEYMIGLMNASLTMGPLWPNSWEYDTDDYLNDEWSDGDNEADEAEDVSNMFEGMQSRRSASASAPEPQWMETWKEKHNGASTSS
ncbi:hypothetical protein GGR57DRAFT_476754 [Xylariaceae sp. FL1272]|nr:hypothetical protein GGR57DRAFT_476754 [Xylariaceae sp. FL1272]